MSRSRKSKLCRTCGLCRYISGSTRYRRIRDRDADASCVKTSVNRLKQRDQVFLPDCRFVNPRCARDERSGPKYQNVIFGRFEGFELCGCVSLKPFNIAAADPVVSPARDLIVADRRAKRRAAWRIRKRPPCRTERCHYLVSASASTEVNRDVELVRDVQDAGFQILWHVPDVPET